MEDAMNYDEVIKRAELNLNSKNADTVKISFESVKISRIGLKIFWFVTKAFRKIRRLIGI